MEGSSESLPGSTLRLQRVFTKVVRPVPEAPQTMRQNWIPFFTFFFFLSRSALVDMDDMVGGGGWGVVLAELA